MSTGIFVSGKVKLYTEFCKEKDVEKLINALKYSFGLVCSIDKSNKNLYVVIISKESVKKFQAIVSPYILPNLRYKVGLGTVSDSYYNRVCRISLPGHKRYYSTLKESSPHSSSFSSSENSLFVPAASYTNLMDFKSVIYKENKKKAGVYRLSNLTSGKTYIGSSTNLAKRFSSYFSNNFLTRESKRTKSMIYSALLKYGYSNFKLEVLEYCDSKVLSCKEQEYLDMLRPKYNILKIAGSSLGFRHSPETIAKFKQTRKNRVFSEETKAKFSAANKNRSEEHQASRRAHVLKLNLSKGHLIEVMNVLTNKTTTYCSIRQAASELNTSHTAIRRYLESKQLQLFKGTSKISRRDASK